MATTISKNNGRGPIRIIHWLTTALVAIALSLAPTSSALSEETTGIAGGPNFPAGVEIPFVAGIESTVESSFFIQNLSSRPIELAISHGAPRGVLIEPSEGQKTLFEAGEAAELSFDITVTEPVVPGTYRTSINVTEADPELPESGGSLYVPAITGEVVIKVVGASAFAQMSSVSGLTGLPAVGDLSLIYIGSSGTEIQINETTGSVIESTLVPGNYRFTFDLPGLQRQEFDFSIFADEQLDLKFEIPTLEFLETAAIPIRGDRGYIQSVALTFDVFNNLGQIDEQIFFQANISRNGELVEEFVVGALPNLPQAGSVLKANYLRENGFEQGDWEFAFEVVGDNFSLTAEDVVVINSPGIFQSYLQEIIIAVGALVILGLLIPNRWWAFILRRPTKAPARDAKKSSAEKVDNDLVGSASSVRSNVREAGDSKGLKSRNPFTRKQANDDPLEQVLSIRRRLEELAEQGVRTSSFHYKIDAMFAEEGTVVINKSTGEPYSQSELEAINEYRNLEQRLKQIETSELKAEAMRLLMRERMQPVGSDNEN